MSEQTDTPSSTAAKSKQQLTMAEVEALRERLKKAPPPDPSKRVVSKQEAVRELKAEIEALRDKGYGLDELAELLAQGGLELPPSTLKNYMQRARGTGKRKAPRKNKAGASSAQ